MVSPGLAPECPSLYPESVPGMLKRCYSGDALAWETCFVDAPKGPGDTVWDTPSDTLFFSGTRSGTPPGHFGPEGAERLL